jgi:hypothetical protein
MLLYTHLVWSLDLMAFFGPDGWQPTELIARAEANRYFWSVFWLTDSAAGIWAIHLVSLVAFAMLTIGYRSRTASVLAYIAAISYATRAPGAQFGLDKINCMLAMYLMIGPCGARYSVDRWLAARRSKSPLPPPEPSVAANIAVRLIQLHMCVIYLFSGMGKLQGEAWWDGSAVWMSHANLEYQSLDMTWLVNWPKLMSFMTHATVFWELFYVALVWNRLCRPAVLLGALLVHGGIAVALGMITFGSVMLIGNIAFISPQWIDYLVQSVFARGRAGAPALRRATAEI